MAAKPPLVVIVGETASGKSALAMKLALEFNGEIICADSRTVYKGMDIGTAKPTKADQALIPHHVLDVVEPNQSFTAADFQRLAKKAIKEISGRQHLPFLVGGSGLYVDSILFDLKFAPRGDQKLYAELSNMDLPQLLTYANNHEIFLGGIERTNKRHIIRAIERGGVIVQPQKLRENTLILGLQFPRDVLRKRIAQRIDVMLTDGFIEEATNLGKQYGWDYEANTIYKIVKDYNESKASLDDVKNELIKKHMNLAKRQRTWFKRNSGIHWVKKQIEAVDLVTTFLNK